MNILILHGWRLSGKFYFPLIKELEKKGNKVYAPDFPGFGRTKMPKKPYKLDDYVSFIFSYIQKRNLNKFILIGHSFGGRVAIKFCAKYPKFVKKLVLTGVPGVLPVFSFKVKFFLIISKIGRIIFSLPFLKFFRHWPRKFLYKAARAQDYYHAKGAMRQTFKNIISEDLIFPMRKIQSPTLLIWGKEDKITPVWIGQRMKKEIKQTGLQKTKLIIIAKEDHNLPYKNPKIFIKNININ